MTLRHVIVDIGGGGMADLLLRGVDPAAVRGIEKLAKEKGLAREEFLRRELAALDNAAGRPRLTRDDLLRSLQATVDLTDDDVMAQAWS